MPSRYRRETRRLKAAIVARVSAGESLRAIGREAGMPGGQTVRNWARADPAFGAEVLAARRREAWGRLYAYDEAKAEAFLARVRAGEAVRDLVRAPGMPRLRTYRYWKATQPPFAEALFALRGRRLAQIAAQGRARRREFDQGLADRIVVGVNKGMKLEDVLAADPALPSRPVVTRWRREQPEFDAVLRAVFAGWRARRWSVRRVPEALSEAILDRLVSGGSFASIGREPGMPSRQTLRRWVRVDPTFAAEVARACEDREDWYHDRMQIIAEGATSGTLAAARGRIRPLARQLVRLRHRPGARHVRRAARAKDAEADGQSW